MQQHFISLETSLQMGLARPQDGSLIGGNFQDHQQYLYLFQLHAPTSWSPLFLELDDTGALPAARSER